MICSLSNGSLFRLSILDPVVYFLIPVNLFEPISQISMEDVMLGEGNNCLGIRYQDFMVFK